MMIADVLGGLDVDDIADLPGQQALLHGHIERRVAQYVADHHPAAGLADDTLQLPHLVLIDGEGLFQKHVVAPAQQRDGGFYMLGIHGAVDDGIGQPGALRQRLGAFKAHILSKPVHLRRFSAADGVRVGHADDLERLWIFQRIGTVKQCAVSRAHDNCSDLFCHFVPSFPARRSKTRRRHGS